MKIKVFTSEINADRMESKVNDWLAQNEKNITILDRQTAIACSNSQYSHYEHMAVTIWYEEVVRNNN